MKRGIAVLLLLCLISYPFAVGGVVAEVKKKDINRATVEELVEVKGIGLKKAEAILQYIREKGRIETMEELINVKGIGKKTLNNLKGYFDVVPEDEIKKVQK